MDIRDNLPHRIREILCERTPEAMGDDPQCSHAAVLVPLFRDEAGYKVLFTKRTSRLEKHKGQISFPGGAVDEEDETLRETALREAHEEIGLARTDVAILGRIDDLQTKTSNFIVHPFVAVIPHPYDFKVNSREVERLIRVPLGVFFAEDDRYKRPEVEFDGIIRPGVAWQYDDAVIWGATARMLENFVNIMGDRLRLPSP